ncbi:hypothetical protein [Kingella sp. (in: b-proteobacteria)]|uniref:hypothetical protein n=1 Tax=Kingella sp. (in: b-proteobacteria) TaxID=2020713 RepID=UPI0026DBE6B5|nr:hypothetical protein [Kingella sp. (in: b-proteobacteria)]MDO4657028.1 hypothetical protein [Kingella sp. (in: b-proteobacteria)]
MGLGFVFSGCLICVVLGSLKTIMARCRLGDRVATEHGLFNPLFSDEPSPLHRVAALQTFSGCLCSTD